MGTRFIHSSKSTWEIADLLQSIFIMELLQPSKALWFSSPWISDIPVIDNRSNQFVTIEPDWANKKVSLTEVIKKLIDLETRIIIGIRDDKHNRAFISKLESKVGDNPMLRIVKRSLLHEKGLIGDHFYLNGSMNFTFNGISLNEEMVQLITDHEQIAQNRIAFIEKWGLLD